MHTYFKGGGASTYLFMCSPSLCIRFLVAGELVTVVYEGFRMEINLWKGGGIIIEEFIMQSVYFGEW